MKAFSFQKKSIFLILLKTWTPLLLLDIVMGSPVLAQSLKFDFNRIYQKEDYFCKGTVTAGNLFYRVAIEDILGNGVGLHTVRTGSRHPLTLALGRPQDLLAGGARGLIDSTNVSTIRRMPIGRPGTSYTTIRSYTSRTDYVQTEFARHDVASGFNRVWLDSTFISDKSVVSREQYLQEIPPGSNDPTGYMVTYRFPDSLGQKNVPDNMLIRQIINVHGTDFNDSWVEITTIVRNMGPEAIEIGMRYLWDLNIGNDDGPELFEQGFSEFFGEEERSSDWVNFGYLRATGINPNPSKSAPDSLDYLNYNVYLSGITPTNLKRAPLQPTRLQQVRWFDAFFKPFSYVVNSNLKVTENDGSFGLPGGDSAVQFFWGETLDNAITLASKDSVQVTQALFATPAGARRFKLPSTHNPPDDTKPLIYDLEIPKFEFTEWQFEPKPQIEVVLQDQASGLRAFKVENLFNAKIHAPTQLATGTIEPLRIVITAIDENKPLRVNVEAADLCGNQVFRFLTLEPDDNTLRLTLEGSDGSRADLVLSEMKMTNGVDQTLNPSPLPQQFALRQNLPNPFRGGTTIQFDVPAVTTNPGGMEKVELRIYNVLGQLVRKLVDANLPAGAYNTQWNGRDENGRPVAAGVYFYNLTAGNFHLMKKMALIQ